MIFTLTKTDGRIGTGLVDYIKQLNDGVYRVEIEKYYKSRSSQQNKFYWAYLRLISDETGNDTETLHEYCKRKFLPPRFIEIMGDEIKIPSSTTKLNKAEFSEYLMKIEAWCGIPVPREINI